MASWTKPLLFAVGLIAALGAFLYLTIDAGPAATKTEAEAEAGAETPVAEPVKLVRREQFADERSCAECHPGESAAHSRSGHALTLRPVEAIRGLAPYFDKPVLEPGSPGIRWRLLKVSAPSGDRIEMVRERKDKNDENKVTTHREPLQFGFGSGRHGITFVTLIDNLGDGRPMGLEHRMSFFTAIQGLAVTPGHQAWRGIPGEAHDGREVEADEMRRCFGCHSVFLSDRGSNRLDFDQYIPNVGCQSCHGPGAAHIAEARKAEPSLESLKMPFGHERVSAQEELDACGKCHRLPSDFTPDQLTADNVLLVRFQPVGLMKSRCRQPNGEPLRCGDCHDPHFRAESDRPSYERVCLSCHTAGTEKEKTECRVSKPAPVSGCIDCHMPKVPASPPSAFTNHWIRASHPSTKAKAKAN